MRYLPVHDNRRLFELFRRLDPFGNDLHAEFVGHGADRQIAAQLSACVPYKRETARSSRDRAVIACPPTRLKLVGANIEGQSARPGHIGNIDRRTLKLRPLVDGA